MKFLVPIAENSVRAVLDNKPWQWSQIVITRTSLRAIFALGYSSELWLAIHALTQFRALSLGWTACNWPKLGVLEASVNETVEAANEAAIETASDFAGSASSAAHAAYAALFATPDLAASNAGIIMESLVPEVEFENINRDFDWLESQYRPAQAARRLSGVGLWIDQSAKEWEPGWYKTRFALLTIDPNYSVWIDWYERRIRGERAAFDIPGDKGRIEDKAILRRLAEATDEDFWGKGHEYVNATLKGWLDEARENVRPKEVHALQAIDISTGPPEIGHASFEQVVQTPPQDTSAIAYGVNEQGKLDRLPSSDQVHLRDEPDQRRAYDDLREAAAELLAEGQRLGHRLQRALNRFLHSLPDGFEDAEAYLVWRDANALRRLHRAHREAAKSLEPDEARLEPVVAEGLGGLLDLYNNFAFADDGLRAKDEARIAPQERASAEAEARAAIPLVEAILANPGIATPEAIDDIVADAENAELPADDPYSAQVLQQSNESRKNFLAAALAWGAKTLASPKQVGKAVAIGSVTGAAGVVVKVAMTAITGTDYGPLLPFIAANVEILQNYVAIAFPNFEHLPRLIEQLKILWAKRRH